MTIPPSEGQPYEAYPPVEDPLPPRPTGQPTESGNGYSPFANRTPPPLSETLNSRYGPGPGATAFGGNGVADGVAPNATPPVDEAHGPTFRIDMPMSPEPPPQARPRTMSEPAPLPIPGQGPNRPMQTVRIGLWGSPRSGKSTFLAALPLAAMQGRSGTWVVAGTDEMAADYLNQSVNRMVVERRFPRPNRVIEPISWSFHGTPPPSGWGRGLLKSLRRQPPGPVEFTLELHDPPGRFFAAGHISDEAIEHLANAHGLIYLMDPVDSNSEVNFQHFFGALQRLTTRMAASGQMRDGRLPHCVAVCVTKFDDRNLFRHLVGSTDLVVQERDGARLPRVAPERAVDYFRWVCNRMLGGNATMVDDALRAYFHPDRIAYFATSAIGFRLNSAQVFDYRDFDNTVREGDAITIRDIPRPINVLEPLVYLERRVRAGNR